MFVSMLALALIVMSAAVFIRSMTRLSWSRQVDLTMASRLPVLVSGAWDVNAGADLRKVTVAAVDTRASSFRLVVHLDGVADPLGVGRRAA